MMTKEIVVDNFAGGGGASTGIEMAMGRSVDIAINHDPAAIAMHRANHPNTKHYTEDVWKVDPVEACGGHPVALAWFSPDCKHHSKAKGGKPVSKKIRGLAWVAVKWAKKVGVKLDFNPTFFSHKNVKDGLTLSSPDPKIRSFWIKHGIQCLKIAEYFAKELKSPCGINFWMPDGYKDEPSDRLGPRKRMADSLDKIFKYKYNKKAVIPFLESKLFGIGVESYTVCSHEFVMGYAMKQKILALLDMGHFHLSESVADKISSFLMTFGKVAFHISRPVRWDSDHVIRQNDDLRACAQEIVKMGPENFIVALDYFDASINRVAAWVLGMRNMQKELLKAMLVPWKDLTKLQDTGALTAQLVLQEEYKNYPVEEVWAEFCKRNGVVADESWFKQVEKYEKDVLLKR